jgi:hypothetical protein
MDWLVFIIPPTDRYCQYKERYSSIHPNPHSLCDDFACCIFHSWSRVESSAESLERFDQEMLSDCARDDAIHCVRFGFGRGSDITPTAEHEGKQFLGLGIFVSLTCM